MMSSVTFCGSWLVSTTVRSLFFVVVLDSLGLLEVGLYLPPDGLISVVLALLERLGVLAFFRVRGRVVLEVVHPAGG